MHANFGLDICNSAQKTGNDTHKSDKCDPWIQKGHCWLRQSLKPLLRKEKFGEKYTTCLSINTQNLSSEYLVKINVMNHIEMIPYSFKMFHLFGIKRWYFLGPARWRFILFKIKI